LHIVPALLIVLAVLGLGIFLVWQRNRRLEREKFIRRYAFPKGLLDRLAKRQPGLDLSQRTLVSRGLRQFFLAYLNSGRQFVSMPSQVVDDLWHEFILYTKAYEAFCKQAFGQFLHHTPAVVLSPDKHNNEGLRRVWWHTCKEENINPRQAVRLPLLFALDAKLGISGGFRYTPDCANVRESGTVQCAGDFASDSVDGGTDGFADSSSDSGGDSGCGGGCGGD
jgi:hypothetical protein